MVPSPEAGNAERMGHGPQSILLCLSLRRDLVTQTQPALNCISSVLAAPGGECGTHPASQLGAGGDVGEGRGVNTRAGGVGVARVHIAHAGK